MRETLCGSPHPNLKIAQRFIDCGGTRYANRWDYRSYFVDKAFQNGHLKLAMLFLRTGVKLSNDHLVTAIEGGYYDCIYFILKRGVSVNEKALKAAKDTYQFDLLETLKKHKERRATQPAGT